MSVCTAEAKFARMHAQWVVVLRMRNDPRALFSSEDLKMPAKKQQPAKGGKTQSKGKDAGKKAKPAGSGGKAKKKKWSKGKVRDKLNNLCLFDKATYDKLYKEVPNYKLITPAVVSERLKIRASLARRALEELLAKGVVRLVLKHHSQVIYTRAPKGDEH